MPTIVGILTFMSRVNFVLSLVEHKKSFITLGPGPGDGLEKFVQSCVACTVVRFFKSRAGRSLSSLAKSVQVWK